MLQTFRLAWRLSQTVHQYDNSLNLKYFIAMCGVLLTVGFNDLVKKRIYYSYLWLNGRWTQVMVIDFCWYRKSLSSSQKQNASLHRRKKKSKITHILFCNLFQHSDCVSRWDICSSCILVVWQGLPLIKYIRISRLWATCDFSMRCPHCITFATIEHDHSFVPFNRRRSMIITTLLFLSFHFPSISILCPVFFFSFSVTVPLTLPFEQVSKIIYRIRRKQ